MMEELGARGAPLRLGPGTTGLSKSAEGQVRATLRKLGIVDAEFGTSSTRFHRLLKGEWSALAEALTDAYPEVASTIQLEAPAAEFFQAIDRLDGTVDTRSHFATFVREVFAKTGVDTRQYQRRPRGIETPNGESNARILPNSKSVYPADAAEVNVRTLLLEEYRWYLDRLQANNKVDEDTWRISEHLDSLREELDLRNE